MKYKNILITGGSGKLGGTLLAFISGSRTILAPTRGEMDITNREQVLRYFENNEIDSVIHCAAMTSGAECEKNPVAALDANIFGTLNLVKEAIKKKARFVYISTDYVYPCKNGPYKESDPTIPFTIYGWTKLGGECAVKAIANHCIIRTSLLEPEKINFDTAPYDAFHSKIPMNEAAEAIIFLLESDFVGVINVGQERASAYEILKKYKQDIKPVSIKDISFNRVVDSSLDVGLWRSLRRQ